MWNIIIILSLVTWPGVARLVRGSVLSLKERDFIKSSQIAGMSRPFILFSELLPNVVAQILIFATTVMASSILDEAALSFLGVGVQLPAASLGNMLKGAQSLTVLTRMPWLWVPPGVLIIVLVVCVNFIGDALRDAMDPTTIR
jgi:peptide/nickel transport system permease protein